jgi:AcrR family transcriptional regulator
MATSPYVPNAYDERLDSLLATAARVFAEKGFHPTTMRDLARETGMSLAGIYHYVSCKDELLSLIMERCFTRVVEGAEAELAQGRGPRDRLNRFIRHHVTYFARHMSEMKVLSHEAESLTGERVARVNELKRRYVALLVGLIKGIEGATPSRSPLSAPRSRFSGPNDAPDATALDPNVAAYALFGMMNWIYNWYDPKGTVPPETLAEQFSRIFLDGITVPSPTLASHGG